MNTLTSNLVGKRFYHRTNKKEVYTITKVEEDVVSIKGDFGTTTYPLDHVRQFFEAGTWILFESERRKESLLEQARRLYPVGTTFKCLHDCSGGPIASLDEIRLDSFDTIRWYGKEGGCGCIYDECQGGWAEIIPEEIKYYGNLTNHIGRYIQALVDYPHGGNVKKGEYGLIVSNSNVNFTSSRGYACTSALSKHNLNINYKLMPEGFVPPTEEIKTTNMPTAQLTQQSISRSDLKTVHSHVCSKWQDVIKDKLKENIFDESIFVPNDLLIKAFEEADSDQTKLLLKYFYQPLESKEVNMEEWIEDIKLFRKSCRELIDVRDNGKYGGKAFYLTSDFKWEIKTDEYDIQCLVPTKN
jgi:hypothetical protein